LDQTLQRGFSIRVVESPGVTKRSQTPVLIGLNQAFQYYFSTALLYFQRHIIGWRLSFQHIKCSDSYVDGWTVNIWQVFLINVLRYQSVELCWLSDNVFCFFLLSWDSTIFLNFGMAQLNKNSKKKNISVSLTAVYGILRQLLTSSSKILLILLYLTFSC
jgi:hypothetical protein